MASDLSGWRQVSQTDKTLAEVLADGSVAAPDLVGFNDWQKWRKSSGTRPVVARGDPKSTTSAQEVLLWKSTMEELFGDEWRGDLAEKEAALAAAADEEDGAEALPPVGASRAAGAGSSAPAGTSTGGAAGSAAGAPVARAISGFDTPGGRSLGGGSASLRGELPAASRLWESLRQEFDPLQENRFAWQARVLEVVGQLTAMGFVVPESEMEKTVRKAGYAEQVQGKELADQVAYLKAEFTRILLDESGYSEIEHAARMEALIEMLRERGTDLSRSAHKMFTGSTTRASPERPGQEAREGLGGGATPVRGVTVGAQERSPPRADDRTLVEEVAYLQDRLRRAEADRGSGPGGQDVLAQAIALQTEAIAQALKSKETRHSTIKVSPTFKWPILGDDGPDAKEVEEFYEKYEDLCRLANDGRGMSAMEHLTTLVSCLRGSKEKIYRIVYKKHRKLGTVEMDPEAVFAEIRERHMRFIETPMERQMRVLGEWDGLWKGNRSALQFEAVFEETITELELAGLAKNERELLLGYLQKIGPQLAAEVQKDVRSWTDREGKETSRRVSSWEEAHRVHVEFEGIKASGRALVPAYVLGGGKGGGKGSEKPYKPPGAEASGSRPVCHEMRDKNTCRFGDSCR
jgi:hypothetical protein